MHSKALLWYIVCPIILLRESTNANRSCQIVQYSESKFFQAKRDSSHLNVLIPPNFSTSENDPLIHVCHSKSSFIYLHFVPISHNITILKDSKCYVYKLRTDLLRLAWNVFTVEFEEKSVRILYEETKTKITEIETSGGHIQLRTRTTGDIYFTDNCTNRNSGVVYLQKNDVRVPIFIERNSEYVTSGILHLLLKNTSPGNYDIDVSSCNGTKRICQRPDGSLSTNCPLNISSPLVFKKVTSYIFLLPLSPEVKKNLTRYGFAAPNISICITSTNISTTSDPVILTVPIVKSSKLYREYVQEVKVTKGIEDFQKDLTEKYQHIFVMVSLVLCVVVSHVLLFAVKLIKDRKITSHQKSSASSPNFSNADSSQDPSKVTEEIYNKFYIPFEERQQIKKIIGE